MFSLVLYMSLLAVEKEKLQPFSTRFGGQYFSFIYLFIFSYSPLSRHFTEVHLALYVLVQWLQSISHWQDAGHRGLPNVFIVLLQYKMTELTEHGRYLQILPSQLCCPSARES